MRPHRGEFPRILLSNTSFLIGKGQSAFFWSRDIVRNSQPVSRINCLFVCLQLPLYCSATKPPEDDFNWLFVDIASTQPTLQQFRNAYDGVLSLKLSCNWSICKPSGATIPNADRHGIEGTRGCAGSSRNRVPSCAKLSAIYVTVKALYERLVSVPWWCSVAKFVTMSWATLTLQSFLDSFFMGLLGQKGGVKFRLDFLQKHFSGLCLCIVQWSLKHFWQLM